MSFCFCATRKRPDPVAIKLFPQRRARRAPKIEIIPMVDVMFLLLVFYILSSLALHAHKGIPVELPTSRTSEGGETSQEVVLTITSSGEYYLNKDKIDASKLSEAVTILGNSRPGGMEAFRKNSMSLNADMAAQHRHVVYAMDQLRRIGMNNFVIATQGETKPDTAGNTSN